MNLLQVNNVTKSFETGEGTLSVLRGVSLELISGKSLALTGESGSGKSTLLYLIGGLDVPDQGRIQILGRDIANLDDPSRAAIRRGTVGVVFQQFNLIPSLNVAANLSFHARLSGSEDKSWTEHLVHYLGLGTLLNRFPEQLSGGQQQRVAIGRTLAARPALVLADEPTGNLDEATADVVMNLLLELVKESSAGLLMVTHSPRLAERLDQQVHLQAGLIA
ncbi:MAG: ABC transporter ATP-binding protein [Rhodobacteraceae bacterium]|jgi:putative ABC transport system ATP-binding protein|nr:ABC transporter ATP-binding protein [Paracoccaceae bacterium]NCX20100.1 ABC transporter ATP-binding protein [Paracoccaceae bacterium]NCX82949.1 ABC transporter ATP-binding protein [Paracoccaceae bacterium]NCZ65440.1 ABC transporter ATP-binding protein [Paracoccaceae bacterium]